MASPPDVIIFFEFTPPLDGKENEDEWLQITQVKNIGNIGKDIQQKIMRLSPNDQVTLFDLLRAKFEL